MRKAKAHAQIIWMEWYDLRTWMYVSKWWGVDHRAWEQLVVAIASGLEGWDNNLQRIVVNVPGKERGRLRSRQ